MKKYLSLILSFVFSFAFFFGFSGFESVAAQDDVVIVLDPGHGGQGEKNEGARYYGILENDVNLQVAKAAKAELEKYSGVKVYMTRTEEIPLTLEERAEFAKSVNADFVFSIHFNASLEHLFYGSEVWVSTFGEYYQKGHDFGQIVSAEWNTLGLYQKGVKTRIGKSGNDYYGIIRQCVAREIPCVIMEHAYLDHMNDVSMIKTENFVNSLGVCDATAIAKYFGLKSEITGADYSGFTYEKASRPSGKLYQDETGPDVCDIRVLDQDTSNGNILVEMTTKDSQSPVIYFSYSYDGGNTFSTLQMWDRTKDTQSFNVKVPSGTIDPVIVLRSYNNYEKGAQSQPVNVDASFDY
jgi:N-acetylmuramoyl-L-alanine amidase